MNVFNQLLKSLYSPKTVALFRFQGVGKTISYVFILMLIVTIPAGIQLALSLSTGIQQLENKAPDLPDFQIQNGLLVSEIEQPLVVEDSEGTFIFDSTGTTTVADVEQYSEVIALLKEEAIFVTASGSQAFRYQHFGNLTVTKSQLEELLISMNGLLPIIIALILLLLYIFFIGTKFIGILLLSIFGLVVRKERKLSYKQLWILSAYSITLPTILFTITDFFKITVPLSFTLYSIIAIYFLYVTIKNVPLPKKTTQS